MTWYRAPGFNCHSLGRVRGSATDALRKGLSVPAIRSSRGLLAACTAMLACSEPAPDAVAQLEYTAASLERSVLRRARLLSAGVPLRGELAADSVWTNVLGYTFIARRPSEPETGIARVQMMRDGVRRKQHYPGLTRAGIGRRRVSEGYQIVDIFTTQDRHLGSAVAPRSMPGRCILRHLGHVHAVCDSVYRLHMDPFALARWRRLLPVVVRNRGFGPIMLEDGARSAADHRIAAGPASPDSLGLHAARYDLEELTDFTLVGRSRPGSCYRHIFGAGGEYFMTAVHYGAEPPPGRELLRALGLTGGAVPQSEQ